MNSTSGKTAPVVLGVIPARGGSKRLPRKNVLALGGVPLIAYSIQAAKASKTLSDFLVTSEDAEILEVARRFGAPTPFVRPADLSTDTVRNIDTVRHALEFMEEDTAKRYDMVVLLQPTCPFRTAQHIDGAVVALWGSEFPTLASVKGPYKKRDPNLKRIEEGRLLAYCEQAQGDDRVPFYVYNACIYAAKRDYFLREKRLVSNYQEPLIMSEEHSIDIDTELDLQVAETYLTFLDLALPKEESG